MAEDEKKQRCIGQSNIPFEGEIGAQQLGLSTEFHCETEKPD